MINAKGILVAHFKCDKLGCEAEAEKSIEIEMPIQITAPGAPPNRFASHLNPPEGWEWRGYQLLCSQHSEG